MTLDLLKVEIEQLTRQERAALTEWLQQKEEKAWDEQIRTDYRAGKLSNLIDRAEKEFDEGSIREAP